MRKQPSSAVKLSTKNYQGSVQSRGFNYALDTELKKGGKNTAPTPVEYFLAAIGGCVAITLRMYAQKMNWDLGEICVEVSEKTELTSKGIEKTLKEKIVVEKEVSKEQLRQLREVSKKCPIAQMVKNKTTILTEF